VTAGHRLICAAISLVVLVVILNLVRKGRLREEYSLLWIAACAGMILFAAKADLVVRFARLLGIDHPAYSVFALAFLSGMVLAIHLTVVVSKLTAQNWRLTQEIALLKAELDRATGSVACSLANDADAGSAVSGPNG
jgi:hypothetical protein